MSYDTITTTNPAVVFTLLVGVDSNDVNECRKRAGEIGAQQTAEEYEEGGARAGVTTSPESLEALIGAITELTEELDEYEFDDGECCADCGTKADILTCKGCGIVGRIVDCGHLDQPRPIASNGRFGSDPSCYDCEADQS